MFHWVILTIKCNYHPQMKLWEANVFSRVCLPTGEVTMWPLPMMHWPHCTDHPDPSSNPGPPDLWHWDPQSPGLAPPCYWHLVVKTGDLSNLFTWGKPPPLELTFSGNWSNRYGRCKWAVDILLECILVANSFTIGYNCSMFCGTTMIIKYNCTTFYRRTLMIAEADVRFLVHSVIPQVPFTFEFQRLNCNLVTKQSTNYHSSVFEKSVKQQNGNSETKQLPLSHLTDFFPNLMNGNSATFLSLNCHLEIQTQTQKRKRNRRHFENTNACWRCTDTINFFKKKQEIKEVGDINTLLEGGVPEATNWIRHCMTA